MIEYRDTVSRLMLSKYLHLSIVPFICSSKPPYMVIAIVSAIAVGMSDARMRSYSVSIVEVEVSCSACCVRYTRFDVVLYDVDLYDRWEHICFRGIYVR